MSNYTLEQFNDDMNQLGGMIESFYSQQGSQSTNVNNRNSKKGGKCGNPPYNDLFSGGKPSLDASSYDIGYKMKEADGKVWTVKKVKGQKKWVYERRYKILSLNERPYEFYRPYTGAEPKDAAKKAGKAICRKLEMNKNCKINFELKEITRGSDQRSYGPYYGYFEKLKNPKTFQFPGMNKPQTQTHVFKVKLIKK